MSAAERSDSGRLVVVSNRLPFNVTAEGGALKFHESAGGLVTGLAAYIESRRGMSAPSPEHVWVGWPGSTIEPELREELKREAWRRFRSHPVFLTQEEMDQFYFGFCNKTIWPLFHYFTSFTVYQEQSWQQFKRVNEVFCESLLEVVREGDLVWIHDYHLLLLPALVKSRAPGLPVGFFLHIPFPSFEVFRLLPRSWRREILEGMLGADLIGFHTYEYTHHFLQSVLRILGYEEHMGQIVTPDHVVKADTFPMGIHFEKFAAAARTPEVEAGAERLRQTLPQAKLVLAVDRLDYTKGIPNRLEGFEIFLRDNPQHHGRVVLLMVVVPSRIGVDQYEMMKRQIEELVGKINGQFGRVDWTPVVYQYRHVPFESLVALYRASDVCLVTPLRDGMNLVAKEYVAARVDGTGTLILSEMAGAAKELGDAIIINPNNREEIAEALREALALSEEEQKRRNRAMQNRLRRYDVLHWAEEFVFELRRTREIQRRMQAKVLPAGARLEIVERYRNGRRRALFLDYDGTLTPLARHPLLARPDEGLLSLLRALSGDARNSVVIVSGRDRPTLEGWFGALPLGLIAEHGVWYRRRGDPWRPFKHGSDDWKQRILPIMEGYADRLPGAFVEEKDHSLAWHYRLADPEQSFLAAELADHLVNLTRNTDLQILRGSKVIEVLPAGVNKGSAALEWLARDPFDFVLAIGDDATDEELFKALEDRAVTIRVGIASTHARYNLRNPAEVRELLRSLP